MGMAWHGIMDLGVRAVRVCPRQRLINRASRSGVPACRDDCQEGIAVPFRGLVRYLRQTGGCELSGLWRFPLGDRQREAQQLHQRSRPHAVRPGQANCSTQRLAGVRVPGQVTPR